MTRLTMGPFVGTIDGENLTVVKAEDFRFREWVKFRMNPWLLETTF